jgi:hypothetical protein
MRKIPAGIWKKINFHRDLIGVEYFGIGKNKITYHISKVTNQFPYKWVATNPNNIADSMFGKTLNEIKIKLDNAN